MAWLRVGDDVASHPIVARVHEFGALKVDEIDAWYRSHAVFGFVVECGSTSAGHLTDYFVSKGTVMRIGGPSWERLAKDAERAGYWKKTKVEGQAGYLIVDDDTLLHLKLKDEVLLDRKRGEDSRNVLLTTAVRLRDGDQCRWCGITVSWFDRRGQRGATYDHLKPDEPTIVETYLVCCRGCNAGREANPDAYSLRPAPAQPWYHPKTLSWLADRGVQPLRPGTQPDHATERPDDDDPPPPPDTAVPEPKPGPPRGPRPGTQPDHATADLPDPADTKTGGSGSAGSGRDRDGSGRDGSAARSSDQARRRGKRGRHR